MKRRKAKQALRRPRPEDFDEFDKFMEAYGRWRATKIRSSVPRLSRERRAKIELLEIIARRIIKAVMDVKVEDLL